MNRQNTLLGFSASSSPQVCRYSYPRVQSLLALSCRQRHSENTRCDVLHYPQNIMCEHTDDRCSVHDGVYAPIHETPVIFLEGTWPDITWPFVMPSRGLCRQNVYARMLDFDPTQLCSVWTHTDMSAKLCRNEFMSDHCSGIAMWTRP